MYQNPANVLLYCAEKYIWVRHWAKPIKAKTGHCLRGFTMQVTNGTLPNGVTFAHAANGYTTVTQGTVSVQLPTVIFEMFTAMPASLTQGHAGPTGSAPNAALKGAMCKASRLPNGNVGLTIGGAAAIIERFTPGFVGYRGVPLLVKCNVGRNVFFMPHLQGLISAPMVTGKNALNSAENSQSHVAMPATGTTGK
jgi:hypothetical protein